MMTVHWGQIINYQRAAFKERQRTRNHAVLRVSLQSLNSVACNNDCYILVFRVAVQRVQCMKQFMLFLLGYRAYIDIYKLLKSLQIVFLFMTYSLFHCLLNTWYCGRVHIFSSILSYISYIYTLFIYLHHGYSLHISLVAVSYSLVNHHLKK